jgi:ubiquinol-cytochrome c reductase cytochrome b subunit
VVSRRLQAIADWFEERLRYKEMILPSATHPVPRNTASWWYVFGSATLVLFILQVATGICLALVYAPSAASAWGSLEYLNYQQPLGWLLRAMHGWGSNFMVGMMTIHMVQVFLFGAFKYPRELTWIVGVFLFLCTLGMAFTGQVLRFDQDAYWGLGIGVAMMGRAPLVGEQLVHLILGGPIIAAETLSRFFALHVFVVPGLLIALVGVHLMLVLKVGINEWPMPGRLVTRDRYRQDYEKMVHEDGVPFFPDAAQRDMVFAGITILAVVLCAAFFGPIGPNGEPDPTLIETVPRPDFFFLSLFAAFALLPPYMETVLILTAPVLGILFLIALPFLFGTGEKSWKARPMAVLAVVLIFVTLGTLTWLGITSPWSPVMDAWSGAPTPVEMVKGRSPLELQGALIVQSKQCRNCHALGGEGGERGPALDDVATRLTPDQLVRQVIQGGGNMPAYGKNLRPAEVTALVAFLSTMHPRREPAERDSTVPAAPPREAAGHPREAAAPGAAAGGAS